MTLPPDLSKPTGPALTTGQYGKIIGMSSQTIRGEIESGNLHAHRLGRGKRRQYRIPWTEARRHARQIGAL